MQISIGTISPAVSFTMYRSTSSSHPTHAISSSGVWYFHSIGSKDGTETSSDVTAKSVLIRGNVSLFEA